MGHQPGKRIWLVLLAGGMGCNGKIAQPYGNRGFSGKSGGAAVGSSVKIREQSGKGYAIGADFPDFLNHE